MQNGKILITDTPDNIRKGFTKRLYTVRSTEKYKLINTLRKFPGTDTAYPFGDSVHLTLINDTLDKSLPGFLKQEGISDARIDEAEAGIEDRFLELMNREK